MSLVINDFENAVIIHSIHKRQFCSVLDFDVAFASKFDYAANLVAFFRISKFSPDKVLTRTVIFHHHLEPEAPSGSARRRR